MNLCAAMQREDPVEWNGHILKFYNDGGPFFHHLTKQELPASLVKAARKKGLEYFESRLVWIKVLMQEALKISGRPPITVWGVDVNH